jgi:uncharacterized protein (TIGR01777 family)
MAPRARPADSSNMRIALTGATGFVGHHFIRAAVRRGFEIVALTRDPARVVGDCVEVRRFSLEEPPDLRGCDGVVHLAGESVVGLWTNGKKRRIRESRVLGTRRVVEAIRTMATPPEVLVSASAVGIYGEGGETELTEEAPPGGDFLAETCAAWERESSAAEEKCRTVRMRISTVLGRDGGMLRTLRPVFRMGLGGRLGHGRQWMPWIHVDDLTALLLFAVENMEVRGPLNACAPWPVRNADFTRVLARVLRRPAFMRVPGFALRLLFRDFGRAMLSSERVVPAVALEHGFGFQFSELEPALRDALA